MLANAGLNVIIEDNMSQSRIKQALEQPKPAYAEKVNRKTFIVSQSRIKQALEQHNKTTMGNSPKG
jgi:predicted XRE-type DNA-binding protein